MNPKSDVDLLQAYLGGELPADQVAALRARLNAEPGLCDQLLILAREETILSEWARSTSQAENILFDPYHQWLGIQLKDQPPNHYRLLGIEAFEDDPTVIGNAADQRMAHLRNFQSGKHSRDSQRLLNEVAAAKVCLLNSEQKAEYDRELRLKMQAGAVRTGRTGAVAAAPPSLLPQSGSKKGVSSVRSSNTNKEKLNRAVLAGFAIAAAVLLVITGAYLAVTSGPNPSEDQQAATAPDVGSRDEASRPPAPGPLPGPLPVSSPGDSLARTSPGSPPESPRLLGDLIEEPGTPSLPSGDASLETPRAPAGEPIASLPDVPEPGAGRATATQGESAVADRLLELTLALSQTDDATEQMWIYQQMASTLLANVAQADPDDAMTGQFLGNYVQLIQEGVLPRLAVIQLADEHGRLSGVAGSLQSDCRILEILFARGGSPPQGSLAEARLLSNRCRTTAESLLTN